MPVPAETHEVKLSYSDLLAQARSLKLAPADAAILMCHRLGISRASLIAYPERIVTATLAAQIQADFAARTRGVPVAYLCGVQEFYGLTLAVSPDVLIPRGDTETLVDTALAAFDRVQVVHALDLGTGSGAIALAIKHSKPDWQVTALDASIDALIVAQNNAKRLNLNINFLLSSWFDALSNEKFDVIVSNPPYIVEGDWHMTALAYEPKQALTSGADGLDDIRQIIAHAPQFLTSNGWLLLEHGYDQAAAVRDLLDKRGFVQVQSKLDLAGIERCSGGQWLT